MSCAYPLNVSLLSKLSKRKNKNKNFTAVGGFLRSLKKLYGNMSSQLPSSEIQSLYDEKHRKIILKETLVGAPEAIIKPSEIVSSPQDDSWTQHSWQKAGAASIPHRPGKGKKGQRHQPQPKQPNRLQKKLKEALATPLQISKAESMMQKMGWQGGALGKTGTGIMEPVAPNAAYAVKTLGFGQATHTADPPPPKKKKITPHQLKKKALETFQMNVLNQILNFVKNDYESEIVFDRQLFRNERKHVHHLVNEVINENDVAPLESIGLMDLVQEIRAHNYYVLRTESQGTFPDRYLCLFKEAPEHVYLITPKDLREETDAVDEPTEKVEEYSSSNENNKTIINVNKDISIINELVKDENVNLGDTVHKELRNNSQCSKRDSESISVDESVNNKIKVTSNIPEVEKQTSDLESNSKEVIDLTESDITVKDMTVTNNDSLNETKKNDKDDKETKDSNMLSDSSKENTNQDENAIKGLKDKTESESKDSGGNQIIDITENIIEYFKEFSESEGYSEMRFLGPFSSEEMDHINKLVSNLYYHINHIEDKVEDMYTEVFKSLDKERYIFEVKEDINWSPVIHKTDTHEGKRKSTKDHIFFDTEEA